MKKLKNKILIVLISIFTLFLLILLIIFNVNIYQRELKQINEKINRLDFHKPINNLNNHLFLDNEIYIVHFNNGNIENINNYSYNNSLSEDEIKNLISKNITKISKNKVGNLYFNDYVFSLNDNELIIINCSKTNNYLLISLYKSIFIFIIFEIIIIYLSILLTRWLVKPVIETFEKQKQFIYDASHELKTPISIILASAETLENNPNETKWLENIKSETNRMNKLIISLLDLSKSENINEKDLFTSENLSKLIENKSLSFESLMFENDLTLKLNIEKNIMFYCNQDKIKELLGILIDNAIKHAYKNSKIEIRLYKDKNSIFLKIKNRGDEIPEEERKKIFERFYRIDKARNRNENRYGLGLAIAKNIVNNHNGVILVDCKNGYTTFICEFKI
ncbi:MAG: sensor histidine kinase [Bacilli bacterium]